MRILMNSHVALAAYHVGEPVYVHKGTKVVELLEARLLAEKKVLEEGKLAKPMPHSKHYRSYMERKQPRRSCSRRRLQRSISARQKPVHPI